MKHLIRRALAVIGGPIVAAMIAFGIGAILILLMDADPVSAYQGLWRGAFGSRLSTSETLLKASPLLLVGLSMTVAYRCSFWSIGAEGQLQIAALAVAMFGTAGDFFPNWLGVLIMILIGFLFGALWAVIPGFLKVRLRVNEVISTLLLNYVALLFVEYMTKHVVGDPKAYGWGVTRQIASSFEFPILVPGTRLHVGLLISIFCAGLVYFLLWRTTLGYKIRAVGLNPHAAKAGGIDVNRYVILSVILSGGLAGLAGVGEVAGIHHRLISGFSPGYGYLGIIIALLAGLHPLGVIVVAILFGGLTVGADTMSRTAGIDISLVTVISGLIVLFVIAGQQIMRNWRPTWISRLQ
jgi:ABC-type uncharacterized transport system permease subunit